MLFACIFVPDFPAAAIVRSEPELRGAAVAVVEGKPPLLNVVAANERARRSGVELGMTKLQAEARLAALAVSAVNREVAVIRRRSRAQEQAASAALGDCARTMSPRVEEPEDAPDTVLLDLRGLDRLFGTPQSIALELSRRGAKLGLEANVSLCENLDAAICAAHGFAGVTVIGDTKSAERLAPLGLDVLLESARVEPQSASMLLETFDRWGVRTCGTFASLPEVAVAERLGTEGVRLQRLARGEGTRTLAPTERMAEFEEAIELEYPIEDLESLAFVMNRLIEQLCARLSARALSTNELRLRLKLEPNYDEASSGKSTYERTIRLPVPMLDAKTFLRLWQLELRANPPGARVETIWLKSEPVEPRFTQGGLFLPATPEPERLAVTLARIAGIVRSKSASEEIRVGNAEVLDTHAPDAFRMKRFVADVPGDERRVPSGKSAQIEARLDTRTVLRRLRPPARIKVEVREGQPIRIRGMPEFLPSENEIAWCSGPWRISGEWWKDAWARDEWDVLIGDLSCRIYRNTTGDWFLEGTYD